VQHELGWVWCGEEATAHEGRPKAGGGAESNPPCVGDANDMEEHAQPTGRAHGDGYLGQGSVRAPGGLRRSLDTCRENLLFVESASPRSSLLCHACLRDDCRAVV
jgi:hypothetical protein